MKHIKSFKLFEKSHSIWAAAMSGSTTSTFNADQHEEFCQAVLDWVNETGKEIRWSLWANPHKESDEDRTAKANSFNDMKSRARERWRNDGSAEKYPTVLNALYKPESAPKTMDDFPNDNSAMEKAKHYWDMYVRNGNQVTLVEMGDKLVLALIKDGNIEMAFDNMDSKVDPIAIKDFI
jgi:hypothetical protein